jgi:hypothetical protein
MAVAPEEERFEEIYAATVVDVVAVIGSTKAKAALLLLEY